jgi:hypothetical protein
VNNTITKLNLNKTNLSNEGLTLLFEALNYNYAVRRINLGNNEVRADPAFCQVCACYIAAQPCVNAFLFTPRRSS